MEQELVRLRQQLNESKAKASEEQRLREEADAKAAEEQWLREEPGSISQPQTIL